MGLRMKNLDIFVVHWKIRFLEGGHKKSNIEGELRKSGAWTFYRFKGGLGKKEGGVDTPMHTMLLETLL